MMSHQVPVQVLIQNNENVVIEVIEIAYTMQEDYDQLWRKHGQAVAEYHLNLKPESYSVYGNPLPRPDIETIVAHTLGAHKYLSDKSCLKQMVINPLGLNSEVFDVIQVGSDVVGISKCGWPRLWGVVSREWVEEANKVRCRSYIRLPEQDVNIQARN